MTVTRVVYKTLGPAARKQVRQKLEAQGAPTVMKAVGKPNKFGAIKAEVDGRTFHSKAEARHYLHLKDQQRRGLISGLICQPKYPLIVCGVHVADYIGDFEYYGADGKLHVVDVKGLSTPLFRLKAKILYATRGIVVELVDA